MQRTSTDAQQETYLPHIEDGVLEELGSVLGLSGIGLSLGVGNRLLPFPLLVGALGADVPTVVRLRRLCRERPSTLQADAGDPDVGAHVFRCSPPFHCVIVCHSVSGCVMIRSGADSLIFNLYLEDEVQIGYKMY